MMSRQGVMGLSLPLVALGAVALLIVACNDGSPTVVVPGENTPVVTPEVSDMTHGVSNQRVLFGQSAAFSGPCSSAGHKHAAGDRGSFP